jgi:hypothetical protein
VSFLAIRVCCVDFEFVTSIDFFPSNSVYLHNDLILGVIHNATVASDGVPQGITTKTEKVAKVNSVVKGSSKKRGGKAPAETESPNGNSASSTPLLGSTSPAIRANAEKSPFSIGGTTEKSSTKSSKSTKQKDASGTKRKDPSSAKSHPSSNRPSKVSSLKVTLMWSDFCLFRNLEY